MRTVPLFGLLLTLIACFEQGDCSDFSSNVMQVGFYANTDKKVKAILIDSVKMDGWDTVMYKNQNLSAVQLPINPAADSMTYNFYYQSTVATMKINYFIRTYALAPECKAIDIFTIKDVSVAEIQDFKISLPNLSSDVTENIKLYF
jgi:hypothetical protein